MKVLPYYLAIGMPYELFWNGDPRLVLTYRETNKLRAQQKNQEMWVQGIYIHRAVKNVMENFAQGMSGKSGGKVTEYPTEPLPLTELDEKAAIERNKKKTLDWVQRGQR